MYNVWDVKTVAKVFACPHSGGAGRFPNAE
jgi:hypothetical protein